MPVIGRAWSHHVVAPSCAHSRSTGRPYACASRTVSFATASTIAPGTRDSAGDSVNAPQRRIQRSGVTPSPASASPRAGTASTTTSSRPVSGLRLNAMPALVAGTISWITTATRSGTATPLRAA